MNVTVQFFTFAKLTGIKECVLDLPAGSTVADLVNTLRTRFPQLEPKTEISVFLVNGTSSTHLTVLNEGDRVLMLPTSAGG